MKLAAIYSRVSTNEQAKGYSLQTQVEACREYAKTRKYLVAQEFSDDYSGATLDRPGLDQLRDFMLDNPLDVVIVYDVDRLARKSAYQIVIEEEFRRAGVSIEYVIGQYKDNDEGQLQKHIRGVMAEHEKALFIERGKRGRRGKAQSGFVITGARPPYGYRVISEPHKAWLEVDDEEARIVRMIYDWYLKGDENGQIMSANAIAKRLTAMRVPTRGDRHAHVYKKHGNGVWQRAMIIHILTNETYTGIWHFGKTEIIDDGQRSKPKPKCGFGKQVKRPREAWIPVEVPAIIDTYTFALAQKKKAENKRWLRKIPEHDYLMKGRLRCIKCGYAMSVHSVRHQHHYYRCKGKDQVVCLCDLPNFRADDVDGSVWKWAKTIIENPEKLREELDGAQRLLEEENSALFERISIIEEQMNKYQSQLDQLLDLYLDGSFPKEILTERKARLEEILYNLGLEYNTLISRVGYVTVSDDQIADIEKFCATIRVAADKADFNTRRQIVELLDIRGQVVVEKNEKVLYLQCLIESRDPQQAWRIPISRY